MIAAYIANPPTVPGVAMQIKPQTNPIFQEASQTSSKRQRRQRRLTSERKRLAGFPGAQLKG